MVHIAVGIATRLLESEDGGRSWRESPRVVPPRTEPRIFGPQGRLKLPSLAGGRLTDVHIGEEGIGLATGFEKTEVDGQEQKRATFRLTRDGGATWQAFMPDIGFWGRLRAWGGWPPEEIDFVAVRPGGVVAFTWEDPWIFDGPNTHLVLSADGGGSWRYSRAPYGSYWPVRGPGPLRLLGGPHLVVRTASGSFRREPWRFEWNRPPGYWEAGLPLRHVHFTPEGEAFGVAVCWPRDKPPLTSKDLPPPLVALARSDDGGHLWKVMTTWEAPRRRDLNERHEITLDVT